ncbi:MAG: deoxyribose-phosphate aldolase [Bacteroidales bacterium]|nr:deoxyribose-phosphate aldolase [Bacteroidales bacterium]
MTDFLTKYGYAPDQEAMSRALELIAANLDNIASEHVYKECFSMMDLTTLKTDDTPASVTKLVSKVNLFQESYPEWPLPASICVYPNFAAVVKDARKCDFNITVVSACFPSSQSFLEVKLKECEMAVAQGADEVDIVLALNAFLAGDYEAAAEEIRQVRKCIDAVAEAQGRTVHLKVILETGLLRTPEAIANASFLAMEAGADFIKTSTGKVDVNATPASAYVMCECIAKYYEKTGKKIGFKPAGGISLAADALSYYSIVSTILGKEWLNKELFRFGVSRVANSLLSAVEQKTVSFF